MKVYGKGNTVEDLMKGVLGDVQLLSENHGVNAVTEKQVDEFSKAIQEISAVTPSLPQRMLEDVSPDVAYYGSGGQSVHTGRGDINSNSGSGKQFIGKTMHFGGGF